MKTGPQPNGDKTRAKILAFIVRYKQTNDGASPSVREICKGCGIKSTSVIRHHLQILQTEGRIEIDYGIARNIRVPGGKWIYQP